MKKTLMVGLWTGDLCFGELSIIFRTEHSLRTESLALHALVGLTTLTTASKLEAQFTLTPEVALESVVADCD